MKHILYIALLFILFSCNSEKNTYVITFETAGGLVEGSPVVINDYQIGEIKKISLSKEYKINAEIVLNDTIRLPKDSKFTTGSRDLFTKAIIVVPGTSKTYLSSSDVIIGEHIESMSIDTLFNIITNEINNLKLVRNQDSIISELNELNKELKELNEK